MKDENGNNDLRRFLKGLPKVKAKDDFEVHLYKRLRDVESEKFSSPALKRLSYSGKRFSLASLLKPSLIPAVGLTIVLFIFLAYYFNLILINKSSTNQEVVQKTDTQQQTVTSQNSLKDSEQRIASNEQTDTRKQVDITSGEIQLSKTEDQDKTVTIPPVESDQFYKAAPKIESKASDELKMEEKKEEKTMDREGFIDSKKSGDSRSKDSGIQKENKSEDVKVKSYDAQQVQEKNSEINQSSLGKSDTVKAKTDRKKHNKKDKNYKDTVKTDNNENQDMPDSTKSK